MFCSLKRFCIFAMSKRDKKTIKNNKQPKNQQVMKNTQAIIKGNAMLTSVFNQMKFFVQERAFEIVENEKLENNKGLDEIKRQSEVEEILCIDFLRAFSGYCNSQDIVNIVSTSKNAKGFNVYAIVIRDGEEFKLSTDLIIAGGNIQCVHYRYLVNTNLPKLKVNVVEELKKKVSKFENLTSQLSYFKNALTRYEIELLERQFANDTEGIRLRKIYIKDVTKNIEKLQTKIEELIK